LKASNASEEIEGADPVELLPRSVADVPSDAPLDLPVSEEKEKPAKKNPSS
jgi:hypothetical protein